MTDLWPSIKILSMDHSRYMAEIRRKANQMKEALYNKIASFGDGALVDLLTTDNETPLDEAGEV